MGLPSSDDSIEIVLEESLPSDSEIEERILASEGVLIVPVRVQGEIGIYTDDQLMLKKALIAEGIGAEFMHDADHRQWVGFKGPVIGEIIVGLATSGTVAALQAYFIRLGSKHRIRVRAARRIEQDGSRLDWFEASGEASDVAEMFESFKDWDE
jgi:hypothetical protein